MAADIEIGAFVEFMGAHIAEVKGSGVADVVARLGAEQPFGDPNGANSLEPAEIRALKRVAVDRSGLLDLAETVRDADGSVRKLIASATGVLAVSYSDWPSMKALRAAISELDGGRVNVIVSTTTTVVGW